MKLKDAFYLALDAIRHVDCLIIREEGTTIYDGIFFEHYISREESEYQLHTVLVRYWRPDISVKIEKEFRLYPITDAIDFSKLPGLDPEEEHWEILRSSMDDLRLARAELDQIIEYIEENKRYETERRVEAGV